MRRFQSIVLVASVCIILTAAVPLTETVHKAKPSKVVGVGGESERDRLLAPIDNAIKTESDEEVQQQHPNSFLPQSLVPPPPSKKGDGKESKPKVDWEFETGHSIPKEIIERRNKANAAAAYVDSSSFRQVASSPPLPPPSVSSPLLDYALLSDESDHAFFSTRDSFLPDYEFEY